MKHPQTNALGTWALIAIFCVATTVSITNAVRYLPPGGDRFVDFLAHGASDLLPSFNAGAALLRGKNPYRVATNPGYDDPYAAPGTAQHISYLYPPSHAVIYMPVVWLAGYNFAFASQIHLGITLVCLLLLALAVVDLVSAIVDLERATKWTLVPLLGLVLGLNPGSLLGFERGQSDVITATFCWWGVVALRRRWFASAAFLVAAGTLLKGYGLLLAVGAFALGMRRDSWRRMLLGACVAVLLLLGPALRYLPDALNAYRVRSAMFWSAWYNQGFANLLYVLGLPSARFGRHVLVGLALLAAGAAWQQYRVIARDPDDEAGRAYWLSAFSTAALIAVLGYSLNSFAYDCVIVMPGALVLALGQQHLVRDWSVRLRAITGVSMCLALAGLFMFDLGRMAGYMNPSLSIPTAAVAELGFVVLIGAAAARHLTSPRVVKIGMTIFALSVLLTGTLVGIKMGVERSMQASNIARGKPWRASSQSGECSIEKHTCGGGRLPVFFHTNQEQDPWVEIDLGMARIVAVIAVTNREDCCQDEAVPLVLEVSNDRFAWRQVARQDRSFDEWRTRFAPVKARYVRARVARLSKLHLERISVWAN